MLMMFVFNFQRGFLILGLTFMLRQYLILLFTLFLQFLKFVQEKVELFRIHLLLSMCLMQFNYIMLIYLTTQIAMPFNFYYCQILYHLILNIFMEKENNVLKIQNKQNNRQLQPINQLQNLAPKTSIQEAFKKFQKQKFYQLKLNKYLQNTQVDRTSVSHKQQLREKFVQTAKKYIGVPYAQKYHQPEEPLYSAPLFLDCCALVRQSVFDLRQDFGYTLAKWNQSYQFDLLPDQGLKQENLKPGDLIFYSATYFNTKLKPFPHRMVHVQIYLGEGKSIGARWQKGTIQIFDSYKFQSKLYHDIQFHYRSIDSWLEGKFQSHCLQHKWLDQRANQWLSDKFSVFADPSLDDINLQSNEKKDIKDIMIGKGNNSKLVQQYFGNGQKFRLMSEKEQFSHNFYYKWVQSSGQVDFFSFKEGQQIVNHIPNINVISSKLQLLKTLHEMELDLTSKNKAQSLKMSQFVPKTYRLDVMSDQIQFLNDTSEGLWIYKPRNLNQGRGIRMIGDIKQFKRQFIKSKKFYLGEFSLNNMIYYKPELDPSNIISSQQNSQNSANKYSQLKHDGLIQHYIKPLLLSQRKFDIRCYMFVYSNPSIVLFNPGYLRLSMEKYSEQDIQNQQKLFIHLTNNCYQHKHKDYKAQKESTIATWELIQQNIGKQKTKLLEHEVKRILLTTFSAAKRKLMTKKGTYQLLGCDIIVDQNYKPYLLQVNTNPAMFTDTQTQKKIIPKLLHNSIQIALDLFQTQKSQHYAQNAENYGFDLLYCQKTGFYHNLQQERCDLSQQNGTKFTQINGLRLKRQCDQIKPCKQVINIQNN